MTNSAVKTPINAKPIFRPNRSLAHAMIHGPSRPPIPANVNRTPKIVFVFSFKSSETAAVKVGKMIEKKKPVIGKNMERVVNVPSETQIKLDMDAKRMERK